MFLNDSKLEYEELNYIESLQKFGFNDIFNVVAYSIMSVGKIILLNTFCTQMALLHSRHCSQHTGTCDRLQQVLQRRNYVSTSYTRNFKGDLFDSSYKSSIHFFDWKVVDF